MSEDIYSKPDLSKKVKFRKGEKEDGTADNSDNADDVAIYDNYLAEESATPKLEQNFTEDQQQITISSEKSKLLRVAAAFLGLLCLLLLAAVIVLLVLLIQDKSSWNTERRELMSERQELMMRYAEIQRLNANLNKTANLLMGAKVNLTKEREKLQEQFADHFQQGWVHFNHNFYYISSMARNWNESRHDCLQREAHLVIIDSEEEQNFAARIPGNIWIGLEYKENTNWTWVDGTPLNQSYWRRGEPNGVDRNEHCVQTAGNENDRGWNDIRCTKSNNWICEKKVAL